jgi:serine phosphatase RsbU (regulator of sigma subunit)
MRRGPQKHGQGLHPADATAGGARGLADVERSIQRVESGLIALSIVAIAAADRFLVPGESLGFLYLVPVSYSALTHRWPVFLGLLALCVGLRQWDSPVQQSSWGRLALDWALVAVFLGVVVSLRRLGAARSLFFQTARRQRDELVREVEMAAAVQHHLLEQHRPPAGPLDVAARTYPAKVVGGDYYDFIPLDGGRLAVVVADVAGKGLPAALIMPAVKIALRTLAARRLSIAEMLRELDATFFDNLPPASYFTLFYGVLDPGGRQMVYANAGHLPALHLRTRTGEVAWLEPGGPAVGLLTHDLGFHTASAPFDAGDLFVFYTDGITETEDTSGADFGRDRLAAVVRAHRDESAETIAAAVHEAADAFRAPCPRSDDATVIVARLRDGVVTADH